MSSNFIVTERQRELDMEMVPYDVWGTQAHVIMLQSIGVLTHTELERILEALAVILSRIEGGTYQIDPGLGAQLTLEREITNLVGRETGGKVHTGRSRNDQVITAQRLYLRDQLFGVADVLLQVVQDLVELATAHVGTVMPGHTHMQPAKPTTFGQWCLAYGDMFLRDLDRLENAFERHNTNPLGAAESYGTSWPLDRSLTARLLGFISVQEIPLDVVASRGEMEAEISSDLAFVSLHLSKLAQDLLLYSTFEFGMVDLDASVARRMDKLTGSSIMPQKKNPDVLELVRANASVVFSMLFQNLEVLKALPFGYNRDSRETKDSVVTAIGRTVDSLTQVRKVLTGLWVNTERMRQAVLNNYSLATDLADYLAREFRIPYRMTYMIVGKAVDQAIQDQKRIDEIDVSLLTRLTQEEAGVSLTLTQDQLRNILDPVQCVSRRQHIGGASAEQMAILLHHRLELVGKHSAWLASERERIQWARQECASFTEGTTEEVGH